mgnify:CR=1 FL=1|tara:strand:- start:6693 stop:7913 length:1221 start_codon:yes stop_codon:yes gene_type:complete
MAETTGTSAPNYKLSQGTQKRVFEAGVNPTNEKSGKTVRQHLTNAAIADGVDAIATGVKDQIIEKREDTAAREEAWDVGFDAMGDRGSWASGELFDQFQDLESGFRDEYLEAVRKGDKKGQARMLKDQAGRSSGLKGWKETMETAKQVNDMPGGGWSNAFNGNKESQQIMEALTKLDGKSAVTRFGEQGEMVFDIKLKGPPPKTVTKTRREVDEMVAKGTKPLKLKQDMGENLIKIRKDAEEGNSEWDEDMAYQNVVDSVDEDNVSHYFNENILGKTTFKEDFMSDANPVWKKPITIKSTTLKEPVVAGSKQDGIIDAAEWELMIKDEDTKKLIMAEMESQPDIAKHYIADWVVETQRQNVDKGKAKRKNENIKEYYENLPNAEEKVKFKADNGDRLLAAYEAEIE